MGLKLGVEELLEAAASGEEIVRWMSMPHSLKMLYVCEAMHQGLEGVEAAAYVLAANAEMFSWNDADEATECCFARIDMHNEWVDLCDSLKG